MTLVGPRPETPGYVAGSSGRSLLQAAPLRQAGHHRLGQVCAGYASSLDSTRQKLSYDLYYLRNRSLGLDFAIMLRTVATIFGGRGAR
jgi:lipopolysaccharide/colanic/teichoic acid biosynthesis glycosyltransferase